MSENITKAQEIQPQPTMTISAAESARGRLSNMPTLPPTVLKATGQAYPMLDVVNYQEPTNDENCKQFCVALNEAVIACFVDMKLNCSWFVEDEFVRRAWETTLFDQLRGCFSTVNPDSDIIPLGKRYIASSLETYRLNWGRFVNQSALQKAADEYADALVLVDPLKRLKLIQDLINRIDQIQYDMFMQRVSTFRGANRIEFERDMFASTVVTRREGGSATFVVPHRKYEIRSALESACVSTGKDKLDTLVKDYMNFNPHWIIFLKVIVWHLFGTYRKDSYILYRMLTNAGKGFLQGMLGRSGIMVTVPFEAYQRTLSQQPAGIDDRRLLNAAALGVDEAKAVTDGDKAAATHLTINVKHGPQLQIRVHAKVYFCHNEMASLTSGGLDSEFVGRFVAFPDVGKDLTKQPIFAKSKAEYTDATEYFAVSFVNQKINDLQAMGRVAASNFANERLDEFYATNNLADEVGVVSVQLEDIANSVLKAIMERETLYHKKRGALKEVAVFRDGVDQKSPEVVVIQKMRPIIEQVINSGVVSKSEIVKVMRNAANIEAMLTPKNNMARWGSDGEGRNLYKQHSIDSRVKRRGVHLPMDIELEDIPDCWDEKGNRVKLP